MFSFVSMYVLGLFGWGWLVFGWSGWGRGVGRGWEVWVVEGWLGDG